MIAKKTPSNKRFYGYDIYVRECKVISFRELARNHTKREVFSHHGASHEVLGKCIRLVIQGKVITLRNVCNAKVEKKNCYEKGKKVQLVIALRNN